MAKWTVTRWVSERFDPNSIGKLRSDPFNNRPIEIVVSENEGHDGEPEGKCPCVDSTDCCQFEHSRNCCVCHGDHAAGPRTLPCLSDWHKKAESATRERVVDAVVPNMTPEQIVQCHAFFVHKNSPDPGTRVTLIIHEPVKEPTLVEAVEALVNAWGLSEYDSQLNAAVRAALAREKAKGGRG